MAYILDIFNNTFSFKFTNMQNIVRYLLASYVTNWIWFIA